MDSFLQKHLPETKLLEGSLPEILGHHFGVLDALKRIEFYDDLTMRDQSLCDFFAYLVRAAL